MDTVRTVSDSKREFYTYHTRPINSVYRRVVEELMVEMHLLSVNVDFHYDPIYALGVVTSFERFMQGYKPESDQESIFAALCKSVGGDPQQYRQDAENMSNLAQQMSGENLMACLSLQTPPEETQQLGETVQAIAANPKYKYSRLFAIGLYTLLEKTDTELVKDEQKRTQVFQQLSESLHLPVEKMQKDLDLYRSNIEKMTQMLGVLEEALEADRKKRQESTPEKKQEVKTDEWLVLVKPSN